MRKSCIATQARHIGVQVGLPQAALRRWKFARNERLWAWYRRNVAVAVLWHLRCVAMVSA